MEILKRTKSLICVALVLVAAPAFAQIFAERVDEYQLKAAVLFNFTKFVEWPPASGSGSGFSICIFGDDPFGSMIDRLTAGKTAFGQPLLIRRLKENADARQQCGILFLGLAEKNKAAKLLSTLHGAPVLTVGETPEFLRSGGMILLEAADNRVNLVINVAAAEAAGLKVSAKLMTLARPYKADQRAEK